MQYFWLDLRILKHPIVMFLWFFRVIKANFLAVVCFGYYILCVFVLGIFSVILSFQRGEAEQSYLILSCYFTLKYICQVIFMLTSGIGKKNKFDQFFIGETIFCLLFWLFFISIQNHDDNDVLRDLLLFVQFKKREKYLWKRVTFHKLYLK